MEEKILFVDDEEYILTLAEKIFDNNGSNLITAHNAVEAFELMKKNEVAVLVSDNFMPDMSGIELLSKVKNLYPDTVTILMTGYANLQTALDAINKAEIFRFIVKPWNNLALKETVEDALKRYRIRKSIRTGDEATMRSIVNALEVRDEYSKGHSGRVAWYAIEMAKAMGLHESSIKAVRYGGWLHDCGKIGMKESILEGNKKQDDFTEEEFGLMRNHPVVGADMVKDANLPETVINIIRHHHERFDGTGYPSGLNGENIQLETRIVSVADIFDALTTKRPYRNAYSSSEALSIIKSMRGSLLDPKIADIFTGLINSGAIPPDDIDLY